MKKTKSIAVTLFVIFYFCSAPAYSHTKTTVTEDLITTTDAFIRKAQESENMYRFLKEHQKKILPPFSTLLSDYYEDETGLIYNYNERWQKIFNPRGIVPPHKTKEKEEVQEPVAAIPYDPRTLPVIYQYLAVEESMNLVPEDSRFNSPPMELFDIFPIDKDGEAAGFLKNYIRFTLDNRWVQAACILSGILSSGELERFACALNAAGQREKGNYLRELAIKPCGQFDKRAAINMKRLFCLPLDSPNLDSLSRLDKPEEMYYAADEITASYTGFLAEELERLSKQEVKNQGRRLKKEVKHGPLLRKLLAMDILSKDKTLPDAYFLKFLHARENDATGTWLKVAALQALRRRGAAIPKKRVKALLRILPNSKQKKQGFETLSSKKENPGATQGGLGRRSILKDADPFVVFYALYWVEKKDKDRFGEILKQLARGEKSVFQKNALKKVYECFGYDELKAAVSFVKEENLSPPSMKYYLQKAFENRDKDVLVRRFDIKEKPKIMIPSVYALFALDKKETLFMIRQFLTKEYDYFRENGVRRIDGWVMEHLLTMVVDCPVRSDIYPLTVFVKKGFFGNESIKALEYMVPAITKDDIKVMVRVLPRSLLCEAMALHYKPDFLDYITYCLEKGETGIVEAMLKSGHEDLKPLWRRYIKIEEADDPPGKVDELLKTVFITAEDSPRRYFIENIAGMDAPAAVEELTWCVVSCDDATALFAMKSLLDYTAYAGRIDGLMRDKLRADNEFMKVPAAAWFARRGDVSVLPVLESLLYKHPVPRYILIDELLHVPPAKALPIVVKLIRARHLDVWMKIDRVLEAIAGNRPTLLAPFMDDRDTEVKKKIVGALKHTKGKGFKGWKKIREYLANENTYLALYAFEALRGREKWRKKDLKGLVSLYERIKSPTVKVDILEAVGRINTRAAGDFLKAAAESDPLLREYTALYSSFPHKEKLLSILETTEDINIFKRGVRYLRTARRNGSYAAFVMDMIYNGGDEPQKYSNGLYKLSP